MLAGLEVAVVVSAALVEAVCDVVNASALAGDERTSTCTQAAFVVIKLV